MRRYFPSSVLARSLGGAVALCLILAGALAVIGGHPPGSSDGSRDRAIRTSTPAKTRGPRIAQLGGEAALRLARTSLEGGDKSPSLALTRLALAYPNLTSSEKRQADVLLARPTDGLADPFHDGYDPAAVVQSSCTTHFCLHYVTTGVDAPPMWDKDADGTPEWVERIAAKVDAVWAFEVETMGYRPPPPDGVQGGDARFDIYLAQLGDQGMYGYCPAEDPVAGEEYVYSSYCVVDDDFVEFPLDPMPSFRVTVAHELFHAVQYAYDATEDPWFMEASATWMEERFADSIDDNRQYLPYGQLGNPTVPLDQYPAGVAPYGNWLFVEAFARAYGDAAVRTLWERMDATAGAPDEYATQALARFLRSGKSSLRAFYTDFAVGNLTPGTTYEEGVDGAYPTAPITNAFILKPEKASVAREVLLDHFTSATLSFKPAVTLSGAWRLRFDLDLPPAAANPDAAIVVELLSGKRLRRPIELDSDGRSVVHTGFDPAKVARVTVTLTNASMRFDCWQDSSFSCQGDSRDDKITGYQLGATLVPPS